MADDDRDFAGICALCGENAFYRQGVQLTEAGKIVHDACADAVEGGGV